MLERKCVHKDFSRNLIKLFIRVEKDNENYFHYFQCVEKTISECLINEGRNEGKEILTPMDKGNFENIFVLLTQHNRSMKAAFLILFWDFLTLIFHPFARIISSLHRN